MPNKSKYHQYEEYYKEYNRRRKHDRPEASLLATAKRRARVKGLEFSLAVQDIRIPAVCPILGIPIFSKDGSVGPNSPSIDRLDSAKGYTANNIAVISHRANQLKSNMTREIAEKLLRYFDAIPAI